MEHQHLSEKVSVYYLEVHHPRDGKNRYKIDGQVTIGGSSSNDIYLSDFELAPRHCILRVHQEVLTIFQVAESGSTKIGSQELDTGRMYILEKSDKLFLQDIKCIIRIEKEAVGLLNDEDDVEVADDDKTDEGIEVPNLSDNEEFEDDIDDEDIPTKKSFFSKVRSKLFKRKSIPDTEIQEEEDSEEDSVEDKMKDAIYIPKATVNEDVKKPEKKKKKKERIDRSTMPAFFGRVLAFLCEIIIAFAFVSNVAPILEVSSLYDQLFSDISPLVTKGLDYLSPYLQDKVSYLSFVNTFNFISVLATWLALNLISNIVMSVNLGHALIFVRTEGSFVTARIKGLIRFLLSLILSPFIIFDVPALIKKRTLKEVLTASELSYRHGILKVLGNFLILPATTIAIVILPILIEPELLEGPLVTKDLQIKDKKIEIPLQTHPLRSLHMAVSYAQNIKDEWAYSPFINGSKNKLLTGIRFIRMNAEQVEVVSVGPILKTLYPLENIKTISKLDPFFKSKYPQLFKSLETQEFTPESDTDSMALFIDTLSLNQETLPNFLMERGPTLTPYFNLKKALMNQLNIQLNNDVSAKLLAGKKVIEVFPSKIRSTITIINAGKLVTLSISSRQGGRNAVNKFNRVFLSNSAPLLDQASIEPEQINKWTPFDFIDYFNTQSPPALTPPAEGALRNFMQNILAQRGNHQWAQATIDNDYRRSMNTLQEIVNADQDPWASAIFNVMNVDQALWQSPAPTENTAVEIDAEEN